VLSSMCDKPVSASIFALISTRPTDARPLRDDLPGSLKRVRSCRRSGKEAGSACTLNRATPARPSDGGWQAVQCRRISRLHERCDPPLPRHWSSAAPTTQAAGASPRRSPFPTESTIQRRSVGQHFKVVAGWLLDCLGPQRCARKSLKTLVGAQGLEPWTR
jgi:hypothetical protein